MTLSSWLMLLLFSLLPGSSAFGQQSGGNGVPGPASGGGSPTGAAGGVLSGTYPNPGLASNVSLPSTATATTQSPGDNSTKVATDAFVLASITNPLTASPQYQLFLQASTGTVAAAAGSPNIITDASGDLINLNAVGSAVASSPFTEVCGAYQASSTPTYGSDCWTVQDVIGNGVNGTSTLTLSHTGSTTGAHNINLNAGSYVEVPSIEGNINTNNVNYVGGQDSSTGGTTGSAILRGSNNNGTAGTSGSVTVEPGAESGSGSTTQGFATFNQSFSVASALSQTFQVVSMTATADRVQAAPVGNATNNVGVALTVGGTSAQLYVATMGKSTVRFDGTPVVGDIACFPPTSTGTAGLAHDNGATACAAGQRLGVVTGQVSGTGSGATATVLLQIGT